MPPDDCPPAASLIAFHRGEMADPDSDAVAAHVEACDRCEATLGRLDAHETPLVVGLRRTPPAFTPLAPERAGAVVGGRYKLVEPLGEGGMGSVWMALQTDPVRRAVAVKLVKPGMDTRQVLARFEAERQALALMDHPNIAKVLDAGATDRGRPFFVMELVKGVPITRHCDDHRLTPAERLALFVSVCHAVQHAHQKGVIHRDLKPGNVLVASYDDRPVPKVIDFGVAKAAGQPLTDRTLMTGFGAVIGTPEYMSPEQATFNALDVDTRTDVYALGVILYQLLTGATPLSREEVEADGLIEAMRLVREHEPPRPSSKLTAAAALPALAAARGTEPRRLAGLVRGELDWIVMRALEKDRGRRYQSPNDLAADIGRYLAGEPVQAAPPSPAYRTRLFLRRYRAAVAVAALLLATLVAGVVGTTAGLLQARHERRIAESRRAEAVALAAKAVAAERAADARRADAEKARQSAVAVCGFFYQDILRQVDVRFQALWRQTVDPELPLKEAVRAAADRIERLTGLDPRAEVLIRWAVGDSLVGAGDPARAIPHLERALDLMRTAPDYGPEHKETMYAMHKLSEAYRAAGRPRDALRLAEGAFALTLTPYFRQFPGDEATPLYRTDIAEAYLALGQPDAAVRQLEASAAWVSAQRPPMPELEDIGRRNLAEAYRVAGRPADALPLLARALADERARLAVPEPDITDEPRLARLLYVYGRVELDRRDWPAAERHFRECLAIRRRREPRLWTTHATAALLGRTLAALKRPDEAERLTLDACEGFAARESAVPSRHRDIPRAAANFLAERAAARGDAAAAARWRGEEVKFRAPPPVGP